MTALFCAVEADGVTWHHLVTLERIYADGGGPALVVAPCPDHGNQPGNQPGN